MGDAFSAIAGLVTANQQRQEQKGIRAEAKRAADKQKKEQDKILAERKQQQADEEGRESATAARNQARKRQRQKAAGATGRSDTILGATGGGAQTAGKTLLGS